MGEKYHKIKIFEENLTERLKGIFLKERMLFEQMSESILEVSEPISGYWQDDSKGQSAILLLNSRMFNDFESAKLLLMWGLPEQAVMPMRDTIECIMLLRLFENKPELAKRWVTSLAEYSPKNINAELKELNIDAPEYKLYPMLSQVTHPNLLASIMRVEETTLKDGSTYQKFHFGSYENREITAQYFLLLLFLMFFALIQPLAQIYLSYSKDSKIWWETVIGFIPKLEDLGAEIKINDKNFADSKLDKLVYNKFKLEFMLPSQKNGA